MTKADTDWRAGDRVSRTDTQEPGTIVEVDGQIKVKWDSGRTSYYPNHSTEIKVRSDQAEDRATGSPDGRKTNLP